MSINENDISNLKPLYDKVLVKKEAKAERTQSGIVLPKSSDEDILIGTVVSIGDGNLNSKGDKIPLSLKKGDKVLFGQWSGTKLKVSGVEDDSYVLIKESDISGIIGN